MLLQDVPANSTLLERPSMALPENPQYACLFPREQAPAWAHLTAIRPWCTQSVTHCPASAQKRDGFCLASAGFGSGRVLAWHSMCAGCVFLIVFLLIV